MFVCFLFCLFLVVVFIQHKTVVTYCPSYAFLASEDIKQNGTVCWGSPWASELQWVGLRPCQASDLCWAHRHVKAVCHDFHEFGSALGSSSSLTEYWFLTPRQLLRSYQGDMTRRSRSSDACWVWVQRQISWGGFSRTQELCESRVAVLGSRP